MNLLLVVILSFIVLAVIIAIAARLLTRMDQRRQAQADFASYMEAIFMWSEQRDSLSMAREAMEAVETHTGKINQIRRVTEKGLNISRARRDYLEEYARLQRRHNELLKRSKSRDSRQARRKDKTYLMAARFQEAVVSLTRSSQRQTG